MEHIEQEILKFLENKDRYDEDVFIDLLDNIGELTSDGESISNLLVSMDRNHSGLINCVFFKGIDENLIPTNFKSDSWLTELGREIVTGINNKSGGIF